MCDGIWSACAAEGAIFEYARAAGWDACTPAAATQVRVRHQPPYVFTDDEVRRLFTAIDSQPMSSFTSKAMVDPVLFRVLYGAGLRVSEALHLTLADVDASSGTLRVRDSKNGESRTVPVTAAGTSCSIFIDSRITTGRPWRTRSPGATSTAATVPAMGANVAVRAWSEGWIANARVK